MGLEPVHHGPTWEVGEDGKFLLPERTLGWEVLAWAHEYLLQPDGPDAGSPWKYTPEQARFLMWWYALDERGRFSNRYAMLRRSKGWGKDPFAATVCAAEFVGPCRFDGWDAQGRPVAAPHPASWVITTAVSKDQTRITMSLFPVMLSGSCIDEYSIDIGKEILYARGNRSRLEAVTSSPRALEGARSTFTLKSETQHWLRTNDGHKMAEVLTRNAAKARDASSRIMSISNAHEPGEDSDAEHDWEAHLEVLKGTTRAKGILYDSLEAPPSIDLKNEEELLLGLHAARGDSVWLDAERLIEEIYDPRNSPSTSRRFYLNHIVAAEDAWLAPHTWDSLAEPSQVEPGEMISMGFDGSKSDDSSVLVGCRLDDGYVFVIGAWEAQAFVDHEIPRELVDAAVGQAFDTYDVRAFFSDLHPFETYVDAWADEFGMRLKKKAAHNHPIAWDMRVRVKESTIEMERLHDEIMEKAFRHDGNVVMRQHFHNARRRPNRWGMTVGKEHRNSSRKIDSVPAVMLARCARRALGPQRKRTGRAVFV